jgi:hypothetical protein
MAAAALARIAQEQRSVDRGCLLVTSCETKQRPCCRGRLGAHEAVSNDAMPFSHAGTEGSATISDVSVLPTEALRGVFTFPATSTVVYGPGAFGQIPDLGRSFGGRRIFAIASAWIDGLDARLADAMGERYVGSFTATKMHVPRESVLEAAAAAREADADLILSIGGGTQIDCASAVCLALSYDIGDRDRFDEFHVRFVYPDKRLSSPFGGDSSVRERDLDARAAEVDHGDQRVGGVESVSAV